jgi:hypothetical protein
MSAQTLGQQVQWQDLKVRSELEVVFEVAGKEGWKDYEIFGYGDMITQPREITGWKLIPADQYDHSIPIEAIKRLHEVINAGVQVQGVIIADDTRRIDVPPAPAKPKESPPAASTSGTWIGTALVGLVFFAGVIGLIVLATISLLYVLIPMVLVGLFACASEGESTSRSVRTTASAGTSTRAIARWEYDPKLVVLVDDGNGGTAWVSLFTWYE